MLQTSYSFKSNVSIQKSSTPPRLTYQTTSRASRAREHYLQVEVSSSSIFQSSTTNNSSSSTEAFIEGMRGVGSDKRSSKLINTN